MIVYRVALHLKNEPILSCYYLRVAPTTDGHVRSLSRGGAVQRGGAWRGVAWRPSIRVSAVLNQFHHDKPPLVLDNFQPVISRTTSSSIYLPPNIHFDHGSQRPHHLPHPRHNGRLSRHGRPRPSRRRLFLSLRLHVVDRRGRPHNGLAAA